MRPSATAALAAVVALALAILRDHEIARYENPLSGVAWTSYAGFGAAAFFAVAFLAVPFFAALLLAVLFFAVVLRAVVFFAAFLAARFFVAGPWARFSASSSAARSMVTDSTVSALRSVAFVSPSVTYAPKRPSLTTIGFPVTGSLPSSRSGAAAARRPRCLGWA